MQVIDMDGKVKAWGGVGFADPEIQGVRVIDEWAVEFPLADGNKLILTRDEMGAIGAMALKLAGGWTVTGIKWALYRMMADWNVEDIVGYFKEKRYAIAAANACRANNPGNKYAIYPVEGDEEC